MSLVCAQCSRVNPPEASYCYHDGAALAGRAGGPINAGAASFPNQFVFPDGMACRNFDQLAMACQQNWPSAISLLHQGFLGSFFGGMGRVDLAMAAQEAAKFPDLDRGLDQLLAKLPSQALQSPKLQAEPSEISLGQVKIGESRATELHLTNLGMRLLYGTVTSDCEWLTVGDGPGHVEKMFQFGADAVIPVHVRGQHLRAGAKPIEGHLIVDSNGGTLSVTVRADVPVTPYPDGMFAGATTPRLVCDKAKAKPKDAAPLFEHGDVARWYASNGWKYPVQGPIMPGTGSIQQFFEALGVAKAPKVDVNPKSLQLNGAVGKTIDAVVELSTTERKVVYGWASCDQSWAEVGKTKLLGKSATIPITVRVPDPCPPTLNATITVVGNGNQRTTVPIKVSVAGGKAGVALVEELPPIEILEEEAPVIVEILDAPAAVYTPPPAPVPVAVVEEPPPAAPTPTAPMVASELAADDNPFAITDKPAAAPRPGGPGAPPPTVTLPKPPPGLPLLARIVLHFVPLALLTFTCLILIVCDIFIPHTGKVGGADDDPVDKNPHVKLVFDEGRLGGDHYTDSMMFAVHQLFPDDKGKPSVKLNWYENGFGNSVVAKIDNKEKAFGFSPDHGSWAPTNEKGQSAGKYGGKKRTFDIDGIYITQTVTIEPGEPVEVKPGEYKRFLNTCLVRYTLKNTDPKKSHSVGLRVLMDTCIGRADGVPFMLPGVKEVVSTKREFRGAEVPDFVQVLEKESVREPGTILQLNLRVDEKFELPNRFQLTRYPVSNENPDKRILNKWEVPLVDMDDDSCVVIYWDPKDLAPNKTRELAFTYGLGSISESGNKLGLTVGGSTRVKGELTVVALVADLDAKTATLKLPDGLELLKGQSLEQQLTRPRADKDGRVRPNPVTWRVRSTREGKHSVSVSTDTGLSQSRRVTITTQSLFN